MFSFRGVYLPQAGHATSLPAVAGNLLFVLSVRIRYISKFPQMPWLEQTIRRYEHRRWAAEPNRPTLPFAWGLEHIGGDVEESNPREFLNRFVDETLANSDDWFACETPLDYQLDPTTNGGPWASVLTFTSTIYSPWQENNHVRARFFPAGTIGPAVVVLP